MGTRECGGKDRGPDGRGEEGGNTFRRGERRNEKPWIEKKNVRLSRRRGIHNLEKQEKTMRGFVYVLLYFGPHPWLLVGIVSTKQ